MKMTAYILLGIGILHTILIPSAAALTLMVGGGVICLFTAGILLALSQKKED